MNKIVLLVDFTGVCLLAMEHVAILSRESLCRVILLHIAPKDKAGDPKLVQKEVRDFAAPLEKEGVPFAIHIEFGDFFELISVELNKIDPDLLVVGTHGFKGIKQNFQSSNILNLLHKIDTPSLIIQGHALTPQEGYKSILVPMIEADEVIDWMTPTASFAKVFKSDLTILGFSTPEKKALLLKKGEDAQAKFDEAGITNTLDIEDISKYITAFSRSIIEYADIEDCDLIVLILGRKQANYFDILDQENILLNRLGKPILCL
ncbi:MAG: nucleotide-binding universal stress UspA family protein [Bacteroidia bacterium]|jgi:nucleotide-binding universal stress UspA family protein